MLPAQLSGVCSYELLAPSWWLVRSSKSESGEGLNLLRGFCWCLSPSPSLLTPLLPKLTYSFHVICEMARHRRLCISRRTWSMSQWGRQLSLKYQVQGKCFLAVATKMATPDTKWLSLCDITKLLLHLFQKGPPPTAVFHLLKHWLHVHMALNMARNKCSV